MARKRGYARQSVTSRAARKFVLKSVSRKKAAGATDVAARTSGKI
jgi:hypothetical protein